MSRVMSASMYPTWTPVTSVPCGCNAIRSEFVADQSAALEQPYAPVPDIHDSTETMSMSAPPPLRARIGANALVTLSTPKKFVSNTARMSCQSPSSRDGRPALVPALLKTMVASEAVSANSATETASVTSQGTQTTLGSPSGSGL